MTVYEYDIPEGLTKQTFMKLLDDRITDMTDGDVTMFISRKPSMIRKLQESAQIVSTDPRAKTLGRWEKMLEKVQTNDWATVNWFGQVVTIRPTNTVTEGKALVVIG